jgi:hypothetical protein
MSYSLSLNPLVASFANAFSQPVIQADEPHCTEASEFLRDETPSSKRTLCDESVISPAADEPVNASTLSGPPQGGIRPDLPAARSAEFTRRATSAAQHDSALSPFEACNVFEPTVESDAEKRVSPCHIVGQPSREDPRGATDVRATVATAGVELS